MRLKPLEPGQRSGHLAVQERSGSIRGMAAWLCSCDCGGSIRITGTAFRLGYNKSCGCGLSNTTARIATALDKFARLYRVDSESGCWLWIGQRSGRRYGAHCIAGRTVKAHRFSWELHYGPIPSGAYVCHKCDTPLCVNPRHLFVGTQADNMRDMAAKGRAASRPGQNNPIAVPVSIARAIAADRETPARDLARDHGVSAAVVYRIRNGTHWSARSPS